MNPADIRAAAETVATALERGEIPPLGKPAALAELINVFAAALDKGKIHDPGPVIRVYVEQLLAAAAQHTTADGPAPH